MRQFSTALTLLISVALFTGLAFPLTAIAAEDARLTLEVNGIAEMSGQIAIAVYADKKSYKAGANPVGNAVVDADAAAVSAEIDGLAAGPCAITIFHDVNGNGELDSNLMGMPTEHFGFSNGAVARFGPPGFDEAVFMLEPGNNSHVITLTGLQE